jgi:hypothetical protein
MELRSPLWVQIKLSGDEIEGLLLAIRHLRIPPSSLNRSLINTVDGGVEIIACISAICDGRFKIEIAPLLLETLVDLLCQRRNSLPLVGLG